MQVKLTPTEIKVFESIKETPKRPTDISKELGMPLSSASRYLSNLMRFGLISYEEETHNQKIYSAIGGI